MDGDRGAGDHPWIVARIVSGATEELIMLTWQFLHPEMTPEHLGYLPSFLSEDDPRPAREQFDERYVSGWNKFMGYRLGLDGDHTLYYPGDPPLQPLAQCQFRDELIVFYQHAWVAIIQPDRSFEVARMD
jgi:hypothetical protein